tara:strand:+ start:47 stop:325 length:279 start_codon:yes stop_codon:yes gene_type:complete
MTTKELIKTFLTGVLFAGMIYIFIMVFTYFIENEVTPEEIFNPKIKIDYNVPDEVPRHHLRHKEKMRERLLTEASEFPERFTDREIIKLLID